MATGVNREPAGRAGHGPFMEGMRSVGDSLQNDVCGGNRRLALPTTHVPTALVWSRHLLPADQIGELA